MMDKIYIRDRVYIPVRALYDKEETKSSYQKRFFEEKACKACEYLIDRFCHVCETCAAYKGTVKLYSFKEIKGITYIGLPIGDKRNIEKNTGILFEDFKVIDKRTCVPFQYPIKFLLNLYDYQTRVTNTFLKKKYGLIEAPPRTGKTAMMLYLAVKLGYRMVLLADQHEFLEQFLWHIEGNEKEGIPKCTNLPELQRKHKKKLYGFPKTDEDFENFQFFVMTYQQFASETQGKNRLAKLMQQVGTVAVDEVHSAAAPVFSKVVNSFYTRYRFGVTGTVDRKDGRQYVIKKVIGPVVARTTVEAMVPTVYIHDTGRNYSRPPKHWVFAMKRLANDKKRNEMIVKQAIADVKAGHSVVIPLCFKKHIFDIVNAINEEYGKPIAKGFVGGGTKQNKDLRREMLADAKSGKVKVVVGIRRLLQRGINVPRWSMIYTVIPISNKPNYKQETSRVRTPMEGKNPGIRLFYEESMGQSVGCAKNCVAHMKEFKYNFSKDENTRKALAYFASKGRRGGSDGGYDEDAEFAAVKASFSEEDSSSSLGRARAGRR